VTKLRSNFTPGTTPWAMRRAQWTALGLTDEDMEKPKIAIVNTSPGQGATLGRPLDSHAQYHRAVGRRLLLLLELLPLALRPIEKVLRYRPVDLIQLGQEFAERPGARALPCGGPTAVFGIGSLVDKQV
jgi:hypothetical protein